MGETSTITGSPRPAAGWYGPNSGLHTISICALNFVGRVSIQASVALAPGDGDWFSVMPQGVAFWQYPRVQTVLNLPNTGETSTLGFNFNANVIWVRAIVDRSYLGIATSAQASILGTIDSIWLNY